MAIGSTFKGEKQKEESSSRLVISLNELHGYKFQNIFCSSSTVTEL